MFTRVQAGVTLSPNTAQSGSLRIYTFAQCRYEELTLVSFSTHTDAHTLCSHVTGESPHRVSQLSPCPAECHNAWFLNPQSYGDWEGIGHIGTILVHGEKTGRLVSLRGVVWATNLVQRRVYELEGLVGIKHWTFTVTTIISSLTA